MAFFDTTWYVNYGNGTTTGYYAVPVWPGALTSVAAGTWCRQLATPTVGNERCFVCVVAGTTGAAEPVWVVTRGADSAANIDGTVKWMECTGMAGPNGDLTNAPVWVASRVLTLGEVYYDSVSGSLQACTTGGTSKSGAAPTFSATAGVTTTDNTVTWTSLGPTTNYTTTVWKYPHARLGNAFTATWVAAGNTVYVDGNNHAESQIAAITYATVGTIAAFVNVYSVNAASAPPTALQSGASISSVGSVSVTPSYYYFNGFKFNAGSTSSSTTVVSSGAKGTIFENCGFNNLTTNSTSGGNNGSYFLSPLYINCTGSLGNPGQSFSTGNAVTIGGYTLFKGGSLAATGSIPTIAFQNGITGEYSMVFDGTDLSAINTTLVTASTTTGGGWTFKNCKINAGVVISGGSFTGSDINTSIKLHNSDSAATNYRYYVANFAATLQQETIIVRTGGATNGTTPLSWNITTTTSSTYNQPFITEDISQWNAISSVAQTVTVYLTTNSTLDNSKIWLEIEYAGSSSNPQSSTVTTKMPLFGTPTTLTTDSSTWGGSITNKYKITSPSFTPQMAGVIKARVYIAAPSVTIYVDPDIYDSSGQAISRSYMIPGWGYINETGSSGSGASMLVHPGMGGALVAKLEILAGTTSKLVRVFIQNNSVTTGAGLTGLAFGTSGLTAYYIREGASTTTAISLVTSTLGTWTSGGFIVVDATNMPGVYEIGLPNAAIASGAKSVLVFLQGATNMAPIPLEIELTVVDNQSTSYGLTLAKTTNITGFNDIAATAIVSSGAITTSSGAVSTVTTTTNLTNAPTSGDFTSTMKTSLNSSTPTSVTTVTGNVNGSVGSVSGAVGSVTGNVGGSISGSVVGSVGSVLTGGLIDLTSTTYGEPSGPVGSTATLKDMIVWLKVLSRNLITQTATTETLFKDDGTTTISTSTDSDNGTTFSRGKWS